MRRGCDVVGVGWGWGSTRTKGTRVLRVRWGGGRSLGRDLGMGRGGGVLVQGGCYGSSGRFYVVGLAWEGGASSVVVEWVERLVSGRVH